MSGGRLGVGIPHQLGTQGILKARARLQPPKYHTWKFGNYLDRNNTPFLFHLRLNKDFQAAVNIAPYTHRWMGGNEPEWEAQGNDPPPNFIVGYKKWLELTGKPMAIPGVLWSQPILAKPWLEEYFALKGPLPDRFHIHLYCYDAYDLRTQWAAWKAFMRFHNVTRITDISETACWLIGYELQKAVMDEIKLIMDTDPLMGDVYWYSANGNSVPGQGSFARSNLLEPDLSLNPLGNYYRSIKEIQPIHPPVILR